MYLKIRTTKNKWDQAFNTRSYKKKKKSIESRVKEKIKIKSEIKMKTNRKINI